MTPEAFYRQIGGNYQEALGRLMRDDMICRFVKKFPADPSFSQLREAVADCRWDDAFAASHTLKGVALNLAFAELSAAAVALTDALRTRDREAPDPARIRELFARVEEKYTALCGGIGELD